MAQLVTAASDTAAMPIRRLFFLFLANAILLILSLQCFCLHGSFNLQPELCEPSPMELLQSKLRPSPEPHCNPKPVPENLRAGSLNTRCACLSFLQFRLVFIQHRLFRRGTLHLTDFHRWGFHPAACIPILATQTQTKTTG